MQDPLAHGGAPEPPDTLRVVASPTSTARSFVRVLRHRPGPAGPTTDVPTHGLYLASWPPSPDLAQHYRDVVGSTARFPVALPAVVASRLHRDLMGQGDLPVSGLGLVHVATQMWCSGRMPLDRAWQVRAWADGARHVRSGLEVDLWADCRAADVRWTARVVVLSRSRSAAGTEESVAADLPGQVATWSIRTTLDAAESVGRRYARVSGDYNPIHLHALTARAFGFTRAIAHGWWALAAALARLGVDETSADQQRYLEVAYRRPILLPSRPTVLADREAGATRFLVERADAKPHFAGRLVDA